jgi:preprotein translocase subunit SecA
MKQKITLMTKFFGRGTDFPVIDEEVIRIGGLHVIQGFVSADNSE